MNSPAYDRYTQKLAECRRERPTVKRTVICERCGSVFAGTCTDQASEKLACVRSRSPYPGAGRVTKH
jgi:hypothetical protein